MWLAALWRAKIVPERVILIDDIATTAKTLPQFPQLWAAMLTGHRPTVDSIGIL